MSRFFVFLFLLPLLCNGQKKAVQLPYSSVDKLIDSRDFKSIQDLSAFITSTFPDDFRRSRAIFSWITTHIDYSVDLMYTYQYSIETPDVALEAFSTRKAVCAGYAALFDTLAFLSGLQSEVVQGSTRQNFLPGVTGHCWIAVKLDGKWHLIDPTWGSGYLVNEKYARKKEEQFFLARPEILIRTHLPFDPIWQLLLKPLSLYEFNARAASSVKDTWNFEDSINKQLSLPQIEQIRNTSRRLQQFGTNSEATNSHYRYLKNRELEYFNRISIKSTSLFNESVDTYNNYINYKNKQFQPPKADAEIAVMLKPANDKLMEAERGFNLVLSNLNEPELTSQVSSNIKQVAEMKNKVSEEQAFVDKYLGTKKNKRRNLFYTRTYTFFGVPVN